MRDYLIRKNLFILKECPKNIILQDSCIILQKKDDIKNININEIQNIFTIFYLPVWIKSILKNKNVNIIYLDKLGKVNEIKRLGKAKGNIFFIV